MNWETPVNPDRSSPKECIRAARDALNQAYSHPGVTDGQHAIVFIAEAIDWQRRAIEQMLPEEKPIDYSVCRCGIGGYCRIHDL